MAAQELHPNVSAACDCLIENLFDKQVAMVINDDGTVTLHDYDTYVDSVLKARPKHDHEKWQIQDYGDGPFCAACGEKVT